MRCSQACIEAIKVVFYTLVAVAEGEAAARPMPSEDMDLVKTSVSDLAVLLIGRMQRLTREAQLLLVDGSINPLRGLRYMLNCVWKIYDIPGLAALASDANAIHDAFPPSQIRTRCMGSLSGDHGAPPAALPWTQY